MVNDRVERDGGLSGLAVADDQLALAAADRNHRIDGLDSGLQRLLYRTAVDHARGDDFHRPGLVGRDRTFAIDRLAQGVHHAADETFADGDRHDTPGAAHFVAFFDLLIFAEQHRTNLVFFQVQRNAGHAVG